MSKMYIAGKITGLSDYRIYFSCARAAVRERDPYAAVLNPAELPEGMDPSDYMRICMAMIDSATSVCLIKGWTDSKGATIEKLYAEYTHKPLFVYDPDSNSLHVYDPDTDK